MNCVLYLVSEEDGQSMVEYSLILGLIFLVALVAVTSVAGRIDVMYQYILQTLGPTFGG